MERVGGTGRAAGGKPQGVGVARGGRRGKWVGRY